jgi:hypothetical protein
VLPLEHVERRGNVVPGFNSTALAACRRQSKHKTALAGDPLGLFAVT